LRFEGEGEDKVIKKEKKRKEKKRRIYSAPHPSESP
jgi:hypothetical protein